MMHLLAILLALSGFALLALSMGRHQPDIAGRKLAASAARRARAGGYAVLLSVLLLDWAAFGAAYGAIACFGHLSVGAWCVVAWLCVRTRRRTNPAPTKNSTTASRGEN